MGAIRLSKPNWSQSTQQKTSQPLVAYDILLVAELLGPQASKV